MPLHLPRNNPSRQGILPKKSMITLNIKLQQRAMLSSRDAQMVSPLRLSEVIVRPGIYTNSKRLNVAGFKITLLDAVGEQYRKVEELNLKNNLLERLGEIGQFAGLRVLDISNNKVTDQKELLKLAALRNLEVLHVAGNPFLQTRLTNEVLAVLDHLNVEINIEPSWSLQRPDDEQRLQNIMLQNYTELIFLQSLYKKTEMHIELVNKYTLQPIQDPDYRILLKHKDAILELDQFISLKFVQQLRLDAYALKKTLSLVDVIAAYKDLIDRQNNKKTELIALVDKRNNQLKDILEKKRKAFAGIKSDFVLTNALSPKKPRNSSVSPLKITAIKEVREDHDDVSPRVQSSTRRKSRSPIKEIKQQNYEAHYYKNLTKRNPVYHLLYSPLHSLKPKQKDLLIQTLSTNLKEKSIELYRKEEQIRALQQAQRMKIQQLTEQMNIINEQKNQLTKRLLEYETTVTDFHFDVKNKLRLEKQVDRKQLELTEAHANSQLYKQMYQRVCEGVQYMAQVDRKQENLREIAENKIKNQYFSLLYYKHMRLKNLQLLHTYNEQKNSKRLLNKSFVLLKRNAMINNIIKLRIKEKDEILIERAFYSLVDYSVIKQTQKTFANHLQNVDKINVLKNLKLKEIKRKVLKLKYQRAQRHWKHVTTLKVWRQMVADWIRYNSYSLQPMIVRTDQFYKRRLISKVLVAWINSHQLDMMRKAEKMKEVDRMLIRKYMVLPFSGWFNDYYNSQSALIAKQMLLQRIKRVRSTENVMKAFFRKSKKNLIQSRNNFARLLGIFERARWSQITYILQTKTKQFYLESKKNYEKGMKVVTAFRINSKKYLGYKLLKLRAYLSVTRRHKFFSFYPNIKIKRQQIKNMIINLRVASQLRNLNRIFNSWRYQHAREQLILQRKNISPIIEDLRSKEQHHIKMNSILRQELAAKDQKLRLYDKKIENMNFQIVNQSLKYDKLVSTYETSMDQMKMRQLEFMDVIGKLQDKFEVVSAQVDQLAKDQIKKEYEAKYSRFSRVSDLSSTVKLRHSKSPEQ